MEIFKQLKKLGYKHYVDLTIEELDALPIDDIEKRIEYSLVIDWFREKHNMYIEITYEGGLQKDTSLYSFQIWSNQTSNKSDKMNYYKAREQAILKCIELCKR